MDISVERRSSVAYAKEAHRFDRTPRIAIAYAATLNHEAVHATAAAHRVGRDMGRKFRLHAYARTNASLKSVRRFWSRICVWRLITSTTMLPVSDIG
jgi:antirestriction protein ArdC